MAIASRTAQAQRRVDLTEESPEIRGGWVSVRVELGITARAVRARGLIEHAFGGGRVVDRVAVGDPGVERGERGAGQVEQASADVGDVRGDERGLSALPSRDRNRIGLGYLEQERWEAIRAIAQEQILALAERVVAGDVQVAERIAMVVGSDVTARLGRAGRARLEQRDANLAIVITGPNGLVVSVASRISQQEPQSEPLQEKPAPSDETAKHVARTHETLNSTRPAQTKQLGPSLGLSARKPQFQMCATVRAPNSKPASREARSVTHARVAIGGR